MNVDKVSKKLDEVRVLLEEIRECPISTKVVPMEEQRKMRERIEAVFERYDEAIESGKTYLPLIRKELNRIIFTLKRWIEYDEMAAEEFFEDLGNMAGEFLGYL